ncbi:hypothetical protein FHP25_34000 [Vineibacter terrae]|uniref:DUF3224 domain-containing protein n=1 Tax=Vineibacter terrae TaxID=2586908 RepID=A0A5C8P9W8_9HYPH|nr:hypothetical protein [Vineibacter terrae]TXL70550.1 hypothetical protein FHP25_34000 [Vineibacter terrae]
MISRFVTRSVLSALVAMSFLAPSLAQSEEAGINAFSVVRAKGATLRIGEKLGTFVGTLEGPLYIDGSEGPMRAGTIACSAALEIRTEDRAHQGSGHCLITAEDGGEIYGRYTCSGYFLVGCSGRFVITGGSGRLAGMSGEGPMTVRTSIGKLGAGTAATQGVEAEGIVFWRDLKYKLP